jgi:protein TonB
MSIEPRPSPQKDFGSLQSCLVEGNVEQRASERRIRRRALIISISAQSAMLAAIVLFPLFGKPERLALANMTPIPPYYHNNEPARQPAEARPARQHNAHFSPNVFSQPPRIPPSIEESPDPGPPQPPGIPSGPGPANPCAGCIPLDDNRHRPSPPADLRPPAPHRLLVTHLEQAMLVQRVEPVYPPLAKQIHREGHVELRAVIATDGTIRSLEVVSGDAIFLQSAEDAVRQWRYHPTILNGQPVEIETYITVIYTLQH